MTPVNIKTTRVATMPDQFSQPQTTPASNGWNEWSRYVLNELVAIRKDMATIAEQQTASNERMHKEFQGALNDIRKEQKDKWESQAKLNDKARMLIYQVLGIGSLIGLLLSHPVEAINVLRTIVGGGK